VADTAVNRVRTRRSPRPLAAGRGLLPWS